MQEQTELKSCILLKYISLEVRTNIKFFSSLQFLF